jgi:hypothetical protein
MPVNQTVLVRSLDAKRGSILKGDGTGPTLNKKGEVKSAPGPLPRLSSKTVIAVALLALADNSDSSDEDSFFPLIHAPSGSRTNSFPGKTPTKTKIAAKRKAAKEMKKKKAEDKKAAAAARKSDSLAKKQEKMVSSMKAKASTAAAKAKTLRNKLAEVMKAAAVVPEAAHLHKKIKGMPWIAPTDSPPTHTLVLSPQRKPMSAKKRVSVQSPLRSSQGKGDDSSSDELMASVSSGSSGTSTAMVKKSPTSKALQHASQGCGTPAQGRGRLRYAVPSGHGQGGWTGRQSFFGATLANNGLQFKGAPSQSTPKRPSAAGLSRRDYLLATGGGEKTHGGQVNAGGANKFSSLNDLGADDDDSTDGSSFGSDSHPNDAPFFLLFKADSRANDPREAKARGGSDDPDDEESVGLTDDDASETVLSPPRVNGRGHCKDEEDNALNMQGGNSPLVYLCGSTKKKVQHTMDWHREEELILSGVWPGVSDTSLLTRFILCHFDEDPEVYVLFSWWADSRLQEDPDGKICLWEWTSLFSGKSPQGEAAEVNSIHCRIHSRANGVSYPRGNRSF